MKVRHRKFVPVAGDKLERKYMDGKVKKTVKVPPYAILDMEETAQDFRRVIDDAAFDCIDGILDQRHSDELICNAYDLARQHLLRAQASSRFGSPIIIKPN